MPRLRPRKISEPSVSARMTPEIVYHSLRLADEVERHLSGVEAVGHSAQFGHVRSPHRVAVSISHARDAVAGARRRRAGSRLVPCSDSTPSRCGDTPVKAPPFVHPLRPGDQQCHGTREPEGDQDVDHGGQAQARKRSRGRCRRSGSTGRRLPGWTRSPPPAGCAEPGSSRRQRHAASDLPSRISSRRRSKYTTNESAVMPMDTIAPAMPGQGQGEPDGVAQDHEQAVGHPGGDDQAEHRDHAEHPVVQDQVDPDQGQADQHRPGCRPATGRCRASARRSRPTAVPASPGARRTSARWPGRWPLRR